MSSLTNVAQVTRKGVIGFVILIFVVVIGQVGLKVSIDLYKALNPPPPPPPTVGFGVLPLLDFPEYNSGEFEYTLEIPQSKLASYSEDRAVFQYLGTRSNLLALDRAKKQAASLGFVFEPVKISGNDYRWSRSDPLTAVLELNAITGEFEMDVSWETDPDFLNNSLIPNETQAISEANRFLQRGGFLAPDLKDGSSKVTLLTYKGSRFTEALSLSEADFVQVDLFRVPFSDAEILPSDPNKGLARVLISGSRDQGERIVSAEYKYVEVNWDVKETYPVISVSDAWQKVQSGQGFVAVEPETSNKIVLREVEFGYYDSLVEGDFVQPIYVFKGDEDTVVYVQAVSPEWINSNPSSPVVE